MTENINTIRYVIQESFSDKALKKAIEKRQRKNKKRLEIKQKQERIA